MGKGREGEGKHQRRRRVLTRPTRVLSLFVALVLTRPTRVLGAQDKVAAELAALAAIQAEMDSDGCAASGPSDGPAAPPSGSSDGPAAPPPAVAAWDRAFLAGIAKARARAAGRAQARVPRPPPCFGRDRRCRGKREKMGPGEKERKWLQGEKRENGSRVLLRARLCPPFEEDEREKERERERERERKAKRGKRKAKSERRDRPRVRVASDGPAFGRARRAL
jgi:hypothetical protein